MKQISEKNLLELMGGANRPNEMECVYLQNQAAEHVPYDNPKQEEAWWDAWSEAYLRCAGAY